VVVAGTAENAAVLNNMEEGIDTLDTEVNQDGVPIIKTTTGGGTALAVGAIADGDFVKRSGAGLVGNTTAQVKTTLGIDEILAELNNGWIPAGVTWTYASATTFTIAGDYSAVLTKGMKFKLTANSVVLQGYIISAVYGAPNTTVTVVGDALTNHTFTDNYYSTAANPASFDFTDGKVLIQSQTLTGSAASITFSSIPPAFRHLELYISARTDRANTGDGIKFTFNADGGANYYSLRPSIVHSGSLTTAEQLGATSMTVVTITGDSAIANSFGVGIAKIFEYTQAKLKHIRAYGSAFLGTSSGGLIQRDGNGVWNSTNAITSITLAPETGPNFLTGTSVQLYGLMS